MKNVPISILFALTSIYCHGQDDHNGNHSLQQASDDAKWNVYGNQADAADWLGTSNAFPLVFKTNGLPRMTLGTNGVLNVNGLAGTGSRLLFADANGNIMPFVNGGLINSNGSLSFNTINVTNSLTSLKIVTNRLTYTDTVFHLGDSSMLFSSPTAINPLTGTPQTSERMYPSLSRGLSLGTNALGLAGFSVAIGHSATAYALNSIGIGLGASARGNSSLSLSAGSGNITN
ncbi:MAG TPA: hypothetical protein VNX68_08040, partial [Nitrosopumilaceae archaeon]|nr:hypothetical protein [Nitrosopumilaceae archaeon]